MYIYIYWVWTPPSNSGSKGYLLLNKKNILVVTATGRGYTYNKNYMLFGATEWSLEQTKNSFNEQIPVHSHPRSG